jgi:DNA-binding MarR family transcriptional regulator
MVSRIIHEASPRGDTSAPEAHLSLRRRRIPACPRLTHPLHRALGLSVPQFRSLVFIERAAGTSLNGVAANLGLTPPSVSKLIDGLSSRGLVKRRESPGDRRRLTLEITADGAQALARARRAALKSLSRLLGSLAEEELSAVTRAMTGMRRIFAAGAHPLSEGRSHGNT